jgi:hypothetical protein
MCKMIGQVNEIFLGERRRFSMDWADALKPEIRGYPPLARDKIASSTWTLHADSPATAGLTFVEDGFEDDLGVTWVSIESDGTVADLDAFWIVNTITTTGIMPNAMLTKATTNQILKRYYVVRFKDC